MSCYSDHNEDIRTKGSCDLCGGTEPDGPRTGVVASSELGENWSARYHLAKQLPGDMPDVVAPSGLYGFRRATPAAWETQGPVVQVVEAMNGRRWIATPARYYAAMIAEGVPTGLDIDGRGWHLSREDHEAFQAFARQVADE